MPDYIFLMHNDAGRNQGNGAEWERYIGGLLQSGNFQGGSAIGEGLCVRKSDPVPPVAGHITGFIRVSAENIEDARRLVAGNPVYDAGGTVEIRELSRTD